MLLMQIFFKISTILTFAVMSGLAAMAANVSRADSVVIREMEEQLRIASSPADSIAPLYNIYDVVMSDYSASRPVMWELYGVAERAGNTPVRLDLMRNLANVYLNNDSVLRRLEADAHRVPTSDEQRETLMFIHINQQDLLHRKASESERQLMLDNMILKLASQTPGNDIFTQVTDMFALVRLMSGQTQGELLSSYIGRLEGLIDQLPMSLIAIRNKFYTMSAIAYTNSGESEKAVKAEKTLLSIINEMEKKYARAGRPYRTFDRHRYLSYRRLLNNYEAITDEEADRYYSEAKRLADENSELNSDFARYQRPTICYLMKKGRYAEAIPILKAQLGKTTDADLRRFMLSQLQLAASEAGDQQSLIETTLAYNEMLEEFISAKNHERSNELKLIYEVNSLREANADMSLKSQRERTRLYRNISVLGIVAFFAVCILVMVLLIMLHRQRRLAADLKKAITTMREERDELANVHKSLIVARDTARTAERQREEFISNMTHEVMHPLNTVVEYSQMIVNCIDDSKQPYLDKFGQIVMLNADLLQSIFKDVLNMSAAEHSRLSIHRKPSSVNEICQMAITSSANRLQPGVTMTYSQADAPDLTILTDPQRVEMVLVNLLQNAAKFTSEGTITLSYTVNQADKTLQFSVTDTGIGIPAGKEELIFNRFEKLNGSSQGVGLGLAVSKTVARLLKADLRVDTSYTGGARFLFTIPIA